MDVLTISNMGAELTRWGSQNPERKQISPFVGGEIYI